MLDFKDIQLSPHFNLSEFVISQVAQRKGINNYPSNDVIDNLRRLCETVLEPAREALGPLKISSGYRSRELNAAVGGSTTSAHIYGLAADVIPIKVSMMHFANWVRKNVNFDQVILEFGTKNCPAWIHVGLSYGKPRKEVLQTLVPGKYEVIA